MFRRQIKFWFTIFISILRIYGIILSPSWLTRWMFLELNLIAIIPILNFGAIDYFIIQAIAGIIILFGVIRNSMIYILLGIIIKLGIFPFSFWIPLIISNSPWIGGALLSSLTKVSPLIVLTILIIPSINLLFMITVLWGSIYGCFQTRTKKILACSSVSHTGWIRVILTMKIKGQFIYLITYFPLAFILFWMAKDRFLSRWIRITQNKLSFIIILLILRGLPPFSGIWIKFLVFFRFNEGINLFVLLFFVSAALNLFFYSKLILGFLSKPIKLNIKDRFIRALIFTPQFLI